MNISLALVKLNLLSVMMPLRVCCVNGLLENLQYDSGVSIVK